MDALLPAWIKPRWLAKIRIGEIPQGFSLPCLLWLGARTPDGYPRVKIGGRKGRVKYLHRISLEMEGIDLTDREADHQCPNRACFQSEHLKRATHEENMDRVGRAANGQVQALVLLSQEDWASLANTDWVYSIRR